MRWHPTGYVAGISVANIRDLFRWLQAISHNVRLNPNRTSAAAWNEGSEGLDLPRPEQGGLRYR